MSWELMEWARGQRLAPGPKTVLMNLCGRADALGVCFPSQDKIAEDTGYSMRTVRRHIKALEEDGYIERERRQKGYIRRSDSYMIKAPIFDHIIKHPNVPVEEEKMAGANADTVSAAEPDKLTSAFEYSDKSSDEFIYISLIRKFS